MYPYRETVSPNTMGSQYRNQKIYIKNLFGTRVTENPIPQKAPLTSLDPFAVFKDPVTGQVIGIDKSMLSLGFLGLGSAGTGKTNLFHIILSRLLATANDNDICIIFDTKGDYLKEHGRNVSQENLYVIGNGEEYADITRYWNIFAEIMPRGNDGRLVYTPDCDANALEMASALFMDMQSEHQPIFPAMSEQIVAAAMIYFIRKYWKIPSQSMLNNQSLLEFFMKSSTEELKEMLDEMPDQRSCINYISGGKGNQTQGVLSYINSVLRKIFIGAFAQADPAREFSMRDIIASPARQKAVIIIEYDLIRGGTLKPIYGILLEQALKYALGGREAQRRNVYLLIDEFALLPKLPHMASALSFGRSQGIKVLCGVQNISALQEVYGEAGANNILAGFQNIACFHLADYETRKFMVERFGLNYQNISFSAQNNNFNIQREGHCLEDWDILHLQQGQAAILFPNASPFLFHFPRYEGSI